MIFENFIGKFNQYIVTRQNKGDMYKTIIKSFDTKREAEDFVDALPKYDNTIFEYFPTREASSNSLIRGWAAIKTIDIGDLDLNDGGTHYVIDDPLSDSLALEDILTKKYPNSTIVRDSKDVFTMTAKDGSEVATVITNNGKHTIAVQRRINVISEEIKQKLNAQLTNILETYRNKEREHDEFPDETFKNRTGNRQRYKGPDTDHYAVISTNVDVSGNKDIITNNKGERLIPVTKEFHDRYHGFGSYGINTTDEHMSNELYRKRTRHQLSTELLSKHLPNVSASITDVRETKDAPAKDHFAILHVPAHSEEEVSKMPGVRKSPRGRYYTMVPKHVYNDYMKGVQENLRSTYGLGDFHIRQANRKVGNQLGWDGLNHRMNPNKNNFNPNSSNSHEVRIDTILSPQDVQDMKRTNK